MRWMFLGFHDARHHIDTHLTATTSRSIYLWDRDSNGGVRVATYNDETNFCWSSFRSIRHMGRPLIALPTEGFMAMTNEKLSLEAIQMLVESLTAMSASYWPRSVLPRAELRSEEAISGKTR